jgi:hypothetical protein
MRTTASGRLVTCDVDGSAGAAGGIGTGVISDVCGGVTAGVIDVAGVESMSGGVVSGVKLLGVAGKFGSTAVCGLPIVSLPPQPTMTSTADEHHPSLRTFDINVTF